MLIWGVIVIRKAEMGIGTLIVFITFIVIAAIATVVLTSTSSLLQNKALETGKSAAQEVDSSLQLVELYATDGSSDDSVDYFYNTIKLSSGSEPMKFTNNYVLLTLNLNNESQDYTYDGNDSSGTSNIDCNLDPDTTSNSSSMSNSTNDGYFGIKYVMTGPHYTPGYLSEGDIVKICFKAPRTIDRNEEMRFTYLPKTGSQLRLMLTMPSIVSEERVYIYP